MSVDVEDYYQVEAFADRVSRSSWDAWPSRVVDNTKRTMDLLDRHNVKATFFIVGWVADKFPELVRDAKSRGHELACHSYWHRTIYSLQPEEFREDIRMCRTAIEQAAGDRVVGFRAPSWSITRTCMWALDILAEEGFTYDSSIYPIVHDLYGVPGAQRFPYTHQLPNGHELPEYPPATVQRFGVNLPAAGGGYLRILPWQYTRWVMRQLERESPHPVVVYFHPWEIDPEQPRIQGKLKSRFRHYTNLGKMEDRLSKLMQTFAFQPFREVIAATPIGAAGR